MLGNLQNQTSCSAFKRLSVTEEVDMVLKMMRSVRKAGGARRKKKICVTAGSTRSTGRAKPALLAAMWNGSYLTLGLSEPQDGRVQDTVLESPKASATIISIFSSVLYSLITIIIPLYRDPTRFTLTNHSFQNHQLYCRQTLVLSRTKK